MHACLSIDRCNKTLPRNGLPVDHYSSVDTSIPGEQIMFTCNPGFRPQTLMISTCQVDGTWNPDPSGVTCLFGNVNYFKLICMVYTLLNSVEFLFDQMDVTKPLLKMVT